MPGGQLDTFFLDRYVSFSCEQRAQVLLAQQFFEPNQRELLERVDRVFYWSRPMSAIEIRNLAKAYRGSPRALCGIDLDVASGELLVVVGPSGSGKTTLLRLIAGLEQPTRGTIHFGGQNVTLVPPHLRRVAMVFQDLALYSHLKVRDNLAFGLKTERANAIGSKHHQERVVEVAQLLGIEHLLDRYPAELSGGEQQRVALGRAIARRPAVLLFDEPLSRLDGKRRRALAAEIKKLQRQLGISTIYVTHDEDDALALADRVAVLDDGRL